MTQNEHPNPAPAAELPAPEDVKAAFAERFARKGAQDALAYLYDLALTSGYVRTEDIARNICWTADSPYGPLEITITLSKPEKDPRAIAAAALPHAEEAHATGAGEPQCAICWENEGWPGSEAFPAKPLLRIAPITLGGEEWGLQYSPYAYFQEHCIALSREHRPMKVDAAALERLLDFVEQFPCYFMGSNADLPIVGGSILSHDHFQGGRHEFPLMKAPVRQDFQMPAFPAVRCGVVDWPASVVRLKSADRQQILAAATAVLEAWRGFACPEEGILPFAEDGTSHSAVTPIARKLESGAYVFDLVLRNNRTTAERPWGLFHPREELHHIKKENIGLIEIMGMAILPPRLARSLPGVQQLLYVASQGKFTEQGLLCSLGANAHTEPHALWAMDVFARRKADILAEPLPPAGLTQVMQEEVGRVFVQVLEDTAVFKPNSAGWNKFLSHLVFKTR